jgi:hypothetical protein
MRCVIQINGAISNGCAIFYLFSLFALATATNSGYDTHLLNGCGGDTHNMRGD